MAAAVPFAIKAGTMIGGSLLGKKLSGASGTQKTAMQGTTDAANRVGAMSGPLMQTGMNVLGQAPGMFGNAGRNIGAAGNYYRNILSSRQSARESLAPEMTTALDFYRGAENKTKRTMQGGGRDYALAELDRQKVGQLAGFLPAARRNAAEGALNVGGAYGDIGSNLLAGGANLTGQGLNAATSAAYINSGLFNQGTQVREQEGEGGKAWGGILYDVAQALPWGKGTGAKLPTTGPSTTPTTIANAGKTLPSAPPQNRPGGPLTAYYPNTGVTGGRLPGMGMGIRDPRSAAEQWEDFLNGRTLGDRTGGVMY